MTILNGRITDAAVLEEIEEVEEHFHNVERWFGLAAVPTGTHWGDQIPNFTPYQCISGNATWGADPNDEALVLGTADTPVQGGMVNYDAHRILFIDYSVNTEYAFRLVYGTGTLAAAIAAGQTSEVVIVKPIATGTAQGSPVEIKMPRVACGSVQIWGQCANATNNATLDFYIGIHEYDF